MAKDKAKLSDVSEQKRNANRHTVRGSGMLEHSIRKNGVISAITVAKNLETFDGSNTLANCLDIFGDEVEPIFVYTDGSTPVVHVRTDIETADDPKAVELGVAANRVAYVDYDPDIELLLEIDEQIGLGDLYFEDELAALVEAERSEYEDQKEEGREEEKKPSSSDDDYSVFELVMIHDNKLYLLETLNKVKEKFLYDKQEDALMQILREFNDGY
jgi:hypothetical protein